MLLKGGELSGKVNLRFGRARYTIICGTEETRSEILDNQEISQFSGGAGVKAAEAVVGKKVDRVVSLNFGPKALQVFKVADVKVAVVSDGTVAEAIERVKRGQFSLI